MVKKRFLSHNAMDKIMREAGALRVSDGAKEALAEVLEKDESEYTLNERMYLAVTKHKKFSKYAGILLLFNFKFPNFVPNQFSHPYLIFLIIQIAFHLKMIKQKFINFLIKFNHFN